MKYNLENIWDIACRDESSVKILGNGYESILFHGVKITRDNETKYVEILKVMTGSEYYPKLSEHDIEIFLNNGWRYGVYSLALANYRIKLENTKDAIKSEFNGRNRIKRVTLYKQSRDTILQKYNNINNKLNQLK